MGYTLRVIRGDGEEVIKKTLRYLVLFGRAVLRKKDLFLLGLPGGRTPVGLYRLMRASFPFFEKTIILPTDERLVPEEDPRNNYRTMKVNLGDKARILRVRTELDPMRACGEFDKLLSELGPLDLIVLGLGEDGHTASIFPKKACKPCGRSACLTEGPDGLIRVSMSLNYINSSCKAAFLVLGERKREALMKLLRGEDIPASRVRPKKGVLLFTDLPL